MNHEGAQSSKPRVVGAALAFGLSASSILAGCGSPQSAGNRIESHGTTEISAIANHDQIGISYDSEKLSKDETKWDSRRMQTLANQILAICYQNPNYCQASATEPFPGLATEDSRFEDPTYKVKILVNLPDNSTEPYFDVSYSSSSKLPGSSFTANPRDVEGINITEKSGTTWETIGTSDVSISDLVTDGHPYGEIFIDGENTIQSKTGESFTTSIWPKVIPSGPLYTANGNFYYPYSGSIGQKIWEQVYENDKQIIEYNYSSDGKPTPDIKIPKT